MRVLLFVVIGLFLAGGLIVAYVALFGEVEPIDCGRNETCFVQSLFDCTPAIGTFVKEPIIQEYEPSEEDVSTITVHGQKILMNWSEKSREFDAQALELDFRIRKKTGDSCMTEFVLNGIAVTCAMPLEISDIEQFDEVFSETSTKRCRPG